MIPDAREFADTDSDVKNLDLLTDGRDDVRNAINGAYAAISRLTDVLSRSTGNDITTILTLKYLAFRLEGGPPEMPFDPLCALAWEVLDLDTRARNVLCNIAFYEGPVTVDEIQRYGRTRLLRAPNSGKKSVDMIDAALKVYGFELAP